MVHVDQLEYCSANRHSFGSRSADDPECRSVLPAEPSNGPCLLLLWLPRGHRRVPGRVVATTGGRLTAGQGAILQAPRPRRSCLGANRCRGGACASRRFVHSPRCRAKRPSPMPARSPRGNRPHPLHAVIKDARARAAPTMQGRRGRKERPGTILPKRTTGNRGSRHQSVADRPPSTTRTCPFTKAAAGDARKTAAPARSSGAPQRPRGTRRRSQSSNSPSAASAAVMSVRV
jgi:hypothetical protein